METLLPQMHDLSHLTQKANPGYTMAQASSYDRATKPGTETKPEWFANGDAGHFVREEVNNGRKEYVMADLKGPGAVVRIWSANPAGVIRFYIDGESEARYAQRMQPLLTGAVAPFEAPFAYEASRGTNLYFPIPYAKSLKVTVDQTDNNGARSLYYHIGFRTYAPGTSVDSFDPSALPLAQMRRVAALIQSPALPSSVIVNAKKAQLAKGQIVRLPVDRKGGSVVAFAIQGNFGADPSTALRHLILRARFDGEETIVTPLGDFFGSAPGINPYVSLPFTVAKDGSMLCRLPMPFRANAVFEVQNIGQNVVPIVITAATVARPWTPESYTLRAQWVTDRSNTRPFRDMSFLDAKGEGYWLGSMLHTSNPVPDWWGEGDEKVYVDGETFPSTFGTGSEDYYGYAWSSPLLFQRPYHAQTRCDGPGTRGQVSVNRWQIFDPIPFTKSLRFDMEQWHWATVDETVARTAYWYAKPGSSLPVRLNAKMLTPPEIEGMKPVVGAIEGEALRVISKSGGKLENQEGFYQLSGGKQLWWQFPAAGDRLVLEVPVPSAGKYEIIGHFCHAIDYGIHRVTINGKVLDPIDFFSTGLDWKKVSLGVHDLPAGKIKVEFECLGKRAEAKDGSMLGLDYLLLNKK
ncbi:MAG: DUF2961 domain-containing protein [Fimbriimonas sp.]